MRETWPMPSISSHIDTVADSEIEETAVVKQKGNHAFKRMPFGIADALWLSSRLRISDKDAALGVS